MTSEYDRFETAEVWRTTVGSRGSDAERFSRVAASIGRAGEVLDVGCGDGSLLRVLLEKSVVSPGTAFGVDQSETAVRKAMMHTHGKATCLVGSAVSLPFGDRSVDVVACCEVLEHLPPRELHKAVVELKRVADRIIVTVPNREHLQRRKVPCTSCGAENHLYGHKSKFSPSGLKNLFGGFTARKIIGIGPRRNEWLRLIDGIWRRQLLANDVFLCPACGNSNDSAEDLSILSKALLKVARPVGRRRWLYAEFVRS